MQSLDVRLSCPGLSLIQGIECDCSGQGVFTKPGVHQVLTPLKLKLHLHMYQVPQLVDMEAEEGDTEDSDEDSDEDEYETGEDSEDEFPGHRKSTVTRLHTWPSEERNCVCVCVLWTAE